MNQMSVELIDSMGDDRRVANAARVSFGKWKAELDDGDIKLINYLAKHKHESPFRHVQASVRCHAPIFLARQLVKHQVGLCWNEVSRRYVSSEPEFYVPDTWRKRPDKGIKQGSGEDHPDSRRLAMIYKVFTDNAAYVYDDLLGKGVAPEMARMLLPQSMMTQWIWTGSLQAFAHLYKLRIDGHAQKEAQIFAAQINEVMSGVAPNAWDALITHL